VLRIPLPAGAAVDAALVHPEGHGRQRELHPWWRRGILRGRPEGMPMAAPEIQSPRVECSPSPSE
jgi:hypothetical protein